MKLWIYSSTTTLKCVRLLKYNATKSGKKRENCAPGVRMIRLAVSKQIKHDFAPA